MAKLNQTIPTKKAPIKSRIGHILHNGTSSPAYKLNFLRGNDPMTPNIKTNVDAPARENISRTTEPTTYNLKVQVRNASLNQNVPH
jgi:hypothetical protein